MSSGPDEFAREEQARAIAIRVFEQRVAGIYIADEQVIAEHIDLMPELFVELKAVQQLREAMLIADKASSIPHALDKKLASTIQESHSEERHTSESYSVEVPRPIAPGFQVLHQIGQGGQATVYRAMHESTRRPVALKVLNGGAWLDARRRARFDREAMIMASLDHPNIIKIVDRGRTTNSAFYIAMEYVDGWSLDEFAKDREVNDPDHPQQLLIVLSKVARAIHSAHLAGVIHRDLKPSNIRVDRHGEPRVLDFGLAHSEQDEDRQITATGHWIGSIPWFSPEQAAKGENHTSPQTDIYSLAVVVYQCLLDAFPYDVTGAMKDVLQRIAHTRPAIPRKRGSASTYVSSDLEAVLLKALAKKPENRYRSAEEFADDLECVANRQRPKSAVQRSVFWTVLLSISMVLGVLGLSVALMYGMSSAPSQDLPRFTNSFEMTFVKVRPGKFWMGSPTYERGRASDELRHSVTLTRPFWLGTTEVTRKQFATVMGKAMPRTEEASLPMTEVSWANAETFCRRLSELDVRAYRLPTEAEWEYACKLGSPLGSEKNLGMRAWSFSNAKGVLHPVASKQPDELGLFDMLGNAMEWCYERPYDYSFAPATDPMGPPPTTQQASAIVRGGSAASPLNQCRPAMRLSQATDGQPLVGFRVLAESKISDPNTR